VNRLHQVTYADGSTVSYTYDTGNRLTTIVDSLNGTITRTFDNLDRLTSETTPQGTVTYTHNRGSQTYWQAIQNDILLCGKMWSAVWAGREKSPYEVRCWGSLPSPACRSPPPESEFAEFDTTDT
jgi:YD repeat-containing protein